MTLVSELKRRNVHRAAVAYVALSWLLIQIAETVLPAFGFGGRPVRAVIIALLIGFVPAMVLAWAFELTPEGVKRERDLDHRSALAQRTNRLLDRLIMLLLALALAYFALDKLVSILRAIQLASRRLPVALAAKRWSSPTGRSPSLYCRSST